MRRWAHRTHLVGLLTLAVAACAEKERPASKGGIAVTDDAGRRVTLAAPAQRIVSLLPSFTELLFAIGAGDRLVGRTAWCDYPPEALAVRSEEHTSELQSQSNLVCRLLLEKKKKNHTATTQCERSGS